MDQLEKRLNQLKNSYDELPTTDQTDQIMKRIRETEIQKKKKNWKTQLPYVASFMGVLLIGSLLVAQLISSQNATTGEGSNPEAETVINAVTTERLEEEHKQLVSFYNEQKLALEQISIISIPIAEEIGHISEAKALVNQVGSPSYKKYQNEADLEKSFTEYTEFVRNRFQMPKEDLASINESSDVLLILAKQQNFLSKFEDKRIDLAKSGELNKALSTDFTEALKQLNGGLDIDDPEVLEFATAVIENGYYFSQNEEGSFEVSINYELYLNEYNSFLDETEKQFIELMTEGMAADHFILATWDELAQRLVQLEELKNNYQGTSFIIENEYQATLYMYLRGGDNSPAFINGKLDPQLQNSYKSFLENHKDTETHSIVNEYYTLLKEADFSEQAVVDFNY